MPPPRWTIVGWLGEREEERKRFKMRTLLVIKDIQSKHLFLPEVYTTCSVNEICSSWKLFKAMSNGEPYKHSILTKITAFSYEISSSKIKIQS